MRSEPDERLAQPSSHPQTKLYKWIAIVLCLALAIAALFYLQQISAPTSPSSESQTSVGQEPAVAARTADETKQIERVFHEYRPVKVIPLPELNSSDETVRGELLDFLQFQEAPAWLEGDQIIRKNVVAISNLAKGQIAYKHLLIPGPAGKFKVESRDDKLYLSPANHQRFDHLTNLAISIDLDAALRFYVRYRELFQQAYNELGLSSQPFETIGLNAIDELLKTPDVTGDIELRQKAVVYQYADPALEQLSDSQKLLLRIGPDNREKIKAKLMELRNILLGE